ncbi:MAG: hypothetical protein ACLTMO_07080 [Faecalibacterium prausnitzii]
MRRKKLLRQVAAAAVALSMAVSLSAPAFAAEFNLANGGLVITANDDGITVTQEGQTGSTSIADNEEIVVKGTYNGTYNPYGGATLTAEENQQDENQPVTPAKAPAKEETSEETQGAENAPAAEEKQEQKDTENLTDPEQKTETENKDNNSDPDNEEKKEQNAPANGELNASAGEGQESKAEDEDKPKTEAKASAEASTSASDDASNGSRKAPARSSGEKSEIRGIIQIFANTLVKLTLKDATIDQPNAADTSVRGRAAIDIQGSGDVEITVKGYNTLKGCGGDAGIQKNDNVSTGTLTITAEDTNQTLNVSADTNGAAIGGNGYSGDSHGTKNIVIKGGTVNTQGRIGSGWNGGSAENIVITGDAVVDANGGIGGGYGDGKTSITISGNAQVNATYKVDTGSDYGYKYGFGGSDAGLAVIGGGVGSSSKKSHAKVTIQGNAQVTAENRAYGGGAGIGGGANGKGNVTIGGNAQVKATGSAEYHDGWQNNGAGAAIGDGGTTSRGYTGTVQKGENQFSTDKDSIQDGATVEMTNIGHNSSNTVTKTRQNDVWVTDGKTEQPSEECKHQKGSYSIYEETVFPNCTETGSKTYRCRSCGEVVNTVELPVNNNHLYGGTVTVKPTCTEKGYTTYKCSRCHQEYGSHTNIVKALGHQFVETTVDPTCTESGYTVKKCTRCGAPEPQENGSAAPNYTVTGAETYETSVVDGRYIIAVPSEDAALNAVLGDLRAIKAQGADVVVFRTRSRESSLVIDEMLAMGPDATPFVLAHNGSEAQLTINGAAHNELIH